MQVKAGERAQSRDGLAQSLARGKTTNTEALAPKPSASHKGCPLQESNSGCSIFGGGFLFRFRCSYLLHTPYTGTSLQSSE